MAGHTEDLLWCVKLPTAEPFAPYELPLHSGSSHSIHPPLLICDSMAEKAGQAWLVGSDFVALLPMDQDSLALVPMLSDPGEAFKAFGSASSGRIV